MKRSLSILLNLCLCLFVTSAAVCVLSDSFQLFAGLQLLTAPAGILSFVSALTALLVYVLMGFLPMIPKRVFLPVVLSYFVGFLAGFLAMIYGNGDLYHRSLQMDWFVSLGQLILGLGILFWLRGHRTSRWPLFEENQLENRPFGWLNLSLFLFVNIFLLPPALLAYLGLCGVLAVDHFTAGFLTVHPSGLTAQVRRYVRGDGKQIELVPMAHVADSHFYQEISRSFSSNSHVLMEGVSDEHNLLTNGISYKRMARSLGLTEQREEFKPRGKLINADIDVDQFTPGTIALLNLAMLVHVNGVNAGTIAKLAQFSPSPDCQMQLFADIVGKRNQHLLAKIQDELPLTDEIIVPWGAYHMPDLATAIQKQGFHLADTRDYTIIRFRRAGNETKVSPHL